MATTLLGVATALLLIFAWLYVNERDPYLGYTSDPGFARALTWVVLPGVAWVMAAMVTGIVWLTGSRVLAAAAVTFGLPVMVVVSWLPVSAALRHTF